ncbi:Uncharacterised protein [Neisseria canis]|uniref:Uncharacterized protein n=1 Tax=Neisseria canis TaxID=493 RepID=A0A448D783_9NEIS|nr:Uncharacterised protein [Neisseria canis]
MRPTKLGIGCDEITSDGLYTLVEGEYMVNTTTKCAAL